MNGYPSIDWETPGSSVVGAEGRAAAVWRQQLAALHACYPDKPILITEFGYPSFAGTFDHVFGEDGEIDMHGIAIAKLEVAG